MASLCMLRGKPQNSSCENKMRGSTIPAGELIEKEIKQKSAWQKACVRASIRNHVSSALTIELPTVSAAPFSNEDVIKSQFGRYCISSYSCNIFIITDSHNLTSVLKLFVA